MDRTVEIFIDDERLIDVTRKELDTAIGYLANWGRQRFPICRIYNDGKNDLVAVYFEGERRGYTIGAVWRGTEYTFHS